MFSLSHPIDAFYFPGPRLVDRSLPYLGEQNINLRIVGSVQFDKNRKPRKERFFKGREMLSSSVIRHISESCPNIETLTLDRCVIGPHIKTSQLPLKLKVLTLRSAIFVRRASFFDNIWKNLKHLQELRIENLQNFRKADCYAVIESRDIDFDIKSLDGFCFIFYRKL